MPDSLDVRTRDRARLPPGQIQTAKWPVLHYGRVPRADPGRWTFRVFGEVERPFEITWAEFARLPKRDVLCDIHCVTTWSRFDNRFSGVPVQLLLERAGVRPGASHVLVHADEDYTTNLPLSDLARDANLVATHFEGEPLLPEHGGPARLLVPHLYFWKSAKWVRGLELMEGDWPGFWEQNGYHMRGDPWAEERYGRPDPARMRRGPTK
ncbi:MAG TPA: sulfite oxidase-like oxidoreductase [Gemmatimonadales bacterium]|nr:sulfite oxidase-like oxidoreductase [Gemmatimonadales bacterium]